MGDDPHLHPATTPLLRMELLIDGLSKTYGNGVKALDDVTLHIPTGMFGLLGPNGAGKSTLMRTVATLQEADSGTVRLRGNGTDIDVLADKEAVRRVLGYLPQEFGVYPRVSAWQMLDHLALLKGVTRNGERRDLVDALLKKVNLWDHRKRRISGFSGGMKQRFGIAQCLIGDPLLIIVDEPTAGLDPGERNRFYDLLTEIGEQVIVILSTHIVQDVQELCSRMAIIDQGQVRYSGPPADALRAIRGRVWEKAIDKQELEAVAAQHRLISHKLVAGRPIVHVLSDGTPGDGFKAAEPNLEDVFFSTLKGGITEHAPA